MKTPRPTLLLCCSIIGVLAVLAAAQDGGLTIDSVASGTPRIVLNDHVVVAGPIKLASYTVATLPSTAATGREVGSTAIVTDALAPTYAATVVGGGAVTIKVMWDGTNWICN